MLLKQIKPKGFSWKTPELSSNQKHVLAKNITFSLLSHARAFLDAPLCSRLRENITWVWYDYEHAPLMFQRFLFLWFIFRHPHILLLNWKPWFLNLPCFPLCASSSFCLFLETYVVCAGTNRATKTALWGQFAPCLWVSFSILIRPWHGFFYYLCDVKWRCLTCI